MGNVTNDIKNGQLKHAYLLFGEEGYLRNLNKNRLIEALGVSKDDMNFDSFKDKTTPEAIAESVLSVPFFSDKRVIVVKDSGLAAASAEPLAKALKQIPDTTYIIFDEKKIDKKCGVYKAIDAMGGTVECNMPSERDLSLWIGNIVKKAGKVMTKGAWDTFYESTCSNKNDPDKKDMEYMEFMSNELEKVLAYCLDKKEITEEDIRAICSPTFQNHIFELIDAIGKKNKGEVLRLYEELLSGKKVQASQIFAMVVKQFQLMLSLHALLDKGYNSNTAASELKRPPFVIQKMIKSGVLNHFPPEVILELLNDANATQLDIRNGKLTDRVGLELLMLKYAS